MEPKNDNMAGAPPENNNKPIEVREEVNIEFSLKDLSYMGCYKDNDMFTFLLFIIPDGDVVAIRQFEYFQYVARVTELTDLFISSFPEGEEIPAHFDMCFPLAEELEGWEGTTKSVKLEQQEDNTFKAKEVSKQLKVYEVFSLAENVDIIPLDESID